MSTTQEKPKFVSSIPNNKLEPVFIGRPDTDALASSGTSTEKKNSVYVPAFLKNKQEGPKLEKEVPKKPVQKKPQLTVNEFPELPSSKKSEVKSVGTGQIGRTSYLEMLKNAKSKQPEEEKKSVEEPVAPKGMLLLGRNMDNQARLSSWGEDENEELDFTQPVPIVENYEEEEEAEEDDEFYEIERYYRRR